MFCSRTSKTRRRIKQQESLSADLLVFRMKCCAKSWSESNQLSTSSSLAVHFERRCCKCRHYGRTSLLRRTRNTAFKGARGVGCTFISSLLLQTTTILVGWCAPVGLPLVPVTEYIPIFLLLLEPHYLRWTELIIIGDFKNKNLSLAVEELNKRVQHRAFPMLKRLVYTVKPDSWPEGWNTAQSALAPQILVTTWDLPSLEILELRNYIPTQIKGSPTIFRLSLLDDTGGAYWGEWDVNALTTLLQSFDQLVELDLCFSSSCFTELDYNLYAELPQLMKLNITLLSVQNTDILHAFSAPALKELSVRCEQFDQLLISRVAEALFPATMCRWPSLQSLNIDFGFGYYSGCWASIHPLDTILSRLPNISSLEITSRNLPDPSATTAIECERRGSPFPPLRSLSIKNTDFNTAYLISIRNILSSSVFEKLCIDNCKTIIKNVVRSILPPEKTLIYDGIVVSTRSPDCRLYYSYILVSTRFLLLWYEFNSMSGEFDHTRYD